MFFQRLKHWETRERKKLKEYEREKLKEDEKQEEMVPYCPFMHILMVEKPNGNFMNYKPLNDPLNS